MCSNIQEYLLTILFQCKWYLGVKIKMILINHSFFFFFFKYTHKMTLLNNYRPFTYESKTILQKTIMSYCWNLLNITFSCQRSLEILGWYTPQSHNCLSILLINRNFCLLARKLHIIKEHLFEMIIDIFQLNQRSYVQIQL